MNKKQFFQQAKNAHSKHAKFLEQLKKKPPKNLDQLTKKIHEEVFTEIDCTKCAECCLSLGPLFTENDITRIAKVFNLKLAAFEEMYLRTDEDGDKVFQSMPCPFLDNENLCTIYDVRPKACREFPHTDRKKFYQINHLTLKNTLTCPACYLFVEKLMKALDYGRK